MANMRDWYTGQLVAQEEMDDAFAQLEAADRAILADGGATGIYSGLGVTQHAGSPNLTVDIATGTAYGPGGERMRAGSSANLNCAVDKNGVTTTVTVNIESRILSVILTPDRTLADPRTDATNSTVYWIRDEAYRIELIQGAQAVIPTPPSIPAESILLADVTRLFGQTQILDADIALNDRRQDQVVLTGTPFSVRRGRVKDALQDMVSRYDDHVGGFIDQHDASALTYGGSGFWADGATTVSAGSIQGGMNEIVSDLASEALNDSGGQRVGIDQDNSIGSNVLAAATVKSRLQTMRLATALFYAGSPAWADASVIAAGTMEAAIDAIPTALGATTGGQKVGMAAVGNFANGTLQGGFAALAATTVGNDGASKVGRQAVGNFAGTTVAAQFAELAATTASNDGAKKVGTQTSGNFAGATVRAQIDELTGTGAANDGAKRVGAQANGTLSSGTVRTQLDQLDTNKAALAGATFTGEVKQPRLSVGLQYNGVITGDVQIADNVGTVITRAATVDSTNHVLAMPEPADGSPILFLKFRGGGAGSARRVWVSSTAELGNHPPSNYYCYWEANLNASASVVMIWDSSLIPNRWRVLLSTGITAPAGGGTLAD